jgi:cytochrome c553
MMKSNYVVAMAMTASMYVGGMAHGADVPADTMTDAQKAALHKTVETCGTCHGVNGRSVSPTFPNLAGQQAPYIELQLKAFKDQSRADPDAQAYMWGMASQLSDATISALAGYFSTQPAAPADLGTRY